MSENLGDTVKVVDTEEFLRDYSYLDGYDDVVTCKASGIVFKSNYVRNGFYVQLVKISNMEALRSIEDKMNTFRAQLQKEGF